MIGPVDSTGDVDEAARATTASFDTTTPSVTHIMRAGDALSGLGPRSYLHSGPPIDLTDIPGPMRGALIGALLFEGEAPDPTKAAAILDAGDLSISPCHENCAVGAMAGVVTPRMPGVLAEAGTLHAFSPLNEGTAGAVRYGSYDSATLSRLWYLSDHVASSLDAAVGKLGGIEMISVISEGLHRGDECHNRLVATTANLLALLAPHIARGRREDAGDILELIASNGHFALPFVIATGKVIAESGANVGLSPVVTAMAGNGRVFGIRVSGLGERWFVAPAPIGEPRLLDGATLDDVTPTMGDSMISETIGLGAFALTAAPAISSFIGGTPDQARGTVEEMRSICVTSSSRFLVPYDSYRGTPIGIDVRLVASSGTAPLINNGLAHRQAGRGRVGAGITRTPLEPFIESVNALKELHRPTLASS